MKCLLLVIVVFGFGCASTPEPKAGSSLDKYIGKDRSEVLMAFGAPDKEFTAGEQQYLTYEKRLGSVSMPMYGMMANVPRFCKTTFMVSAAGTIERHAQEGNVCD